MTARDLRDPEKLGQGLLTWADKYREKYGPKPLSTLYDEDGFEGVAPVSGDDSMCRVAVEEYKATLAGIAKEE